MNLNPSQESEVQGVRNRFLEKVSIADGCWLWTAYKRPDGYGGFRAHGKHQPAHRIAYELFRGTIPEDLTIDHLCRVRLCVNPDHLEAVTNRENILRGNGYTAKAARKTHCNRGHELFGRNLMTSTPGHRKCRTCNNWFRDRRKDGFQPVN